MLLDINVRCERMLHISRTQNLEFNKKTLHTFTNFYTIDNCSLLAKNVVNVLVCLIENYATPQTLKTLFIQIMLHSISRSLLHKNYKSNSGLFNYSYTMYICKFGHPTTA